MAIAPQVSFLSDKFFDGRWKKETDKISYFFSDLGGSLEIEQIKTYIFFDNDLNLDNEHVKLLAGSSLKLVECPHCLHDVAKVLVRSSVYKDFLLKVINDESINFDRILVEGRVLYEKSEKTFLNSARKRPKEALTEVAAQVTDIYARVDCLDFESKYMLAEVLSKLERHKEALLASILSLETYRKDVVPRYLLMKHFAILRRAMKFI